MPSAKNNHAAAVWRDASCPLAFAPVPQAEAAAVLAAAGEVVKPAVLPKGKTTVQAADLPFYQGIRLYALADTTLPEPNTRYVFHGPELTVLHDWTNEPLYTLNEQVPLILDESTILPYVRFFFHFVRGQMGRFLFVESVDEIRWLPEATDEEKTAAVAELMPLSYRGVAPDGLHRLVGTVVFRDALFRTNVKVAPREMDVRDEESEQPEHFTLGQMALCNEELLLEELHIAIAPQPGEFG